MPLPLPTSSSSPLSLLLKPFSIRQSGNLFDAFVRGFAIVTPRAPDMDSHGASSPTMDQKITDGLTNAACEWFLIFLMFVHALLSHLLVWFARYCRLQLPCFLCSKLHRPFHWRFLLCRTHRSEVSSFITCQIHDNNLADSRGMCDDCLLSFTKKTGPNPDMHRLLLGKLGFDLLLKRDSSHPRPCSCCDKPWRTRHGSQRLIQLGFPGRNAVSKPNIPTPRTISRRGSGNLKKMRDQKAPPVAASTYAGMAHVGYTELKITSDSDSEFPFSDDDAFVPITDFEIGYSKRSSYESLSEDKISKCKQRDLGYNKNKNTPAESSMKELTHLDASSREKQKRHDSDAVPRDSSDSIMKLDVCEEDVEPMEAGSVPKERVSEEKDDDNVDSKPETSNNISGFAVKDNVNGETAAEEHSSNGDSETETSNNVSSSVPKEDSDKDDGEEINGDPEAETSKNVSGSVPKEHSDKDDEDGINGDSETETSNNDVSGSVANEHSDKDEEDEFKGDSETDTSKNNDVSGSVPKEHSDKDEGDKGNFDNIPNEEPMEDHCDKEPSKLTDTPSTSNETPKLKHSASVESFGSVNSEFEGEILVDRLKQQVEYDRKCLKDLHAELEEERNASAIAANQAMAMITRLQEEKAALHMEALQYLRMMDEQAEHDVDALERANDILADKEKELQDLEMELEYYRVKYPDEPRGEILAAMGISAQEGKDKTPKPSFTNSSSLEMEKERLHISQRLKSLEKKLYQFAEGRLPEKTENGSSGEREVPTSNGSIEFQGKHPGHEDGETTVNGEPLEDEENILGEESNNLLTGTVNRRSLSQDKKEWSTMENEISELKKRLEALKADRDFLGQAFATLEKGKGGVELIEGIARELQELRNLGLTRR